MRPVSDLMDLSGRKALVTGGAGHIGLAVGETLVELGASLSILDLDASACRARAVELSRIREGGCFPVPCDLSDEQAIRKAVHQAIDMMGGLDILIHCAAYMGIPEIPGWVVPFEKQTVEAWEFEMRVNLTSAFVMVQEAKKALSSSDHGSVIFFSSIYGSVGPDMRMYEDDATMGSPAAYSVSKGGLNQMTRYLATVLAPQIRVNTISPGGVWRNQQDSFHKKYVSKTPLGRMATEEDLKGAVAFLASDLSAYVTGHNLAVDGGWTAW